MITVQALTLLFNLGTELRFQLLLLCFFTFKEIAGFA